MSERRDAGAHIPPRPVPKVDDLDAGYWHSGATGVLVLTRCQSCKYWIHPGSPICPNCFGSDLAEEAASGRGVLWTFTVNMHRWSPAFPVPWTVGLVELEEQEGLRVVAPIMGVEPDELRIGMALTVDFEQREDVYVPFFVRVSQ